jgi:hypothetical protein
MRYNRDAKRKPGNWVIGGVENKTKETSSELDLMV